VPEGADKGALARFHREQADAANRVGLNSRAAESWKKAVEQVRGEPNEPFFLRGLLITEQQVGNMRDAIALTEEALKNRFAGANFQAGMSYNLARIYSRLGDARAARAAWERGTAVLETLRRAPASSNGSRPSMAHATGRRARCWKPKASMAKPRGVAPGDRLLRRNTRVRRFARSGLARAGDRRQHALGARATSFAWSTRWSRRASCSRPRCMRARC